MSVKLEHYFSGARVAKNLFTTKVETNKVALVRENTVSKIDFPYNTELSLLPDFIDILAHRDVSFEPKPYWLAGEKYNPVEVFISTVEFFDQHNEPIPLTTIPPEEDVQTFINKVLQSTHKLTLTEQMKILMDISHGSVLGAANVGFLGSRILARGWDQRAYPHITITPETILEASKHLAHFESDYENIGDAPGDTYYFWTHFFAASVYSELNCKHSQALDRLFSIGTPTMIFVRKYISNSPTISNHYEASQLGRNVALALNKMSVSKGIINFHAQES